LIHEFLDLGTLFQFQNRRERIYVGLSIQAGWQAPARAERLGDRGVECAGRGSDEGRGGYDGDVAVGNERGLDESVDMVQFA